MEYDEQRDPGKKDENGTEAPAREAEALGEEAAAASEGAVGIAEETAEDDPPQLSESELNGVIENMCNSKAEEFRMLGYEHVTGREIWDCVSDKYHKTGTPALHKVVNDILSLKVTQFMNWMTMSIYKDRPF